MTTGVPPLADGTRKQVFLHVGAPKTGSTYLQDLLWSNRQRLAEQGVCYPVPTASAHLAATMDLCERAWGGRWNQEWYGAWDDLAATVRAWPGRGAVFSHELMGLASPVQAARAVESVQPADVHLVFTARDFARQLPSDWQEQVKHRHTVTLTRFVDDLVRLGQDAPAPFGELFWGLHDGAHVLAKWADVVPAERIHVLTLPPSGTAQDVLWKRFAGLLGIDPDAFDTDMRRTNSSMGVVETEFLRRFNGATRGQLTYEHGPIVNRTLGQEILAARVGAEPIRLPPEHFDWAVRRSRVMADELRARGYDVVGDLAELVPSPPADDASPVVPEKLAPAAVNAVAFDAVAGLVDEILALRGRTRVLAERLEAFEPGALSELDLWRTPHGPDPDDENDGLPATGESATGEGAAAEGSGRDAPGGQRTP